MYDYGMAIVTALFTFISPCVLPMLPVFVTYFAASEGGKLKTFFNALAFCIGFSIFFLVAFTSLAFLSDVFKVFIGKNRQTISVICGIIVILLGLKFMGYLNLPFLEKTITIKTKTVDMNILNAFIMGIAFSLSIGTCAFAFMSYNIQAIIMTSSVPKGIIIGVIFTATLDLLFLACSLLINQLKGVFSFIKRHYKVVNMISGGLMVILGFLIALGVMTKITALLS